MLCTSGRSARIASTERQISSIIIGPPLGGNRMAGIGNRSAARFPVPDTRFPGQLRDAVFDRPRMMHRAELGSAHRAEFGALEVLGGQRFVVILSRPLGIETEPELLVPIEPVSRA